MGQCCSTYKDVGPFSNSVRTVTLHCPGLWLSVHHVQHHDCRFWRAIRHQWRQYWTSVPGTGLGPGDRSSHVCIDIRPAIEEESGQEWRSDEARNAAAIPPPYESVCTRWFAALWLVGRIQGPMDCPHSRDLFDQHRNAVYIHVSPLSLSLPLPHHTLPTLPLQLKISN